MDKEEYERPQIPLIVYVPDNTVSLTLTATVMEDDESMLNVVNKMTIADLYDARVSGEEWEYENVKYVLTDFGKSMIDKATN